MIGKVKLKEVIQMQPTPSDTSNTQTSLLLYGAVLLANIDYVGVLDYAVKAVVGGLIWLGFKITADYFTTKIKKKDK